MAPEHASEIGKDPSWRRVLLVCWVGEWPRSSPNEQKDKGEYGILQFYIILFCSGYIR